MTKVQDFSSMAAILVQRHRELRPHNLTFVLPNGRKIERPAITGVLKFGAGDIVRGREVTRILTNASGDTIESTVWLGAEVQE